MVEFVDRTSQIDFPIQISGAVYPITIQWSCKQKAALLVDGKITLIAGNGSVNIESNRVAGSSRSGGQLTADIKLRTFTSDIAELPAEFALEQNYPNPFNPLTVIGYQLSAPGWVSVKVYDVLGREIAILVNEKKEPGVYTFSWDASNFPSGVYFYRIRAGNFVETKKMVLSK